MLIVVTGAEMLRRIRVGAWRVSVVHWAIWRLFYSAETRLRRTGSRPDGWGVFVKHEIETISKRIGRFKCSQQHRTLQMFRAIFAVKQSLNVPTSAVNRPSRATHSTHNTNIERDNCIFNELVRSLFSMAFSWHCIMHRRSEHIQVFWIINMTCELAARRFVIPFIKQGMQSQLKIAKRPWFGRDSWSVDGRFMCDNWTLLFTTQASLVLQKCSPGEHHWPTTELNQQLSAPHKRCYDQGCCFVSLTLHWVEFFFFRQQIFFIRFDSTIRWTRNG